VVSNDPFIRKVNDIMIYPWRLFLEKLWSDEIIYKYTRPTQSTINLYSSLNFQIVQFIGYNYFWKIPFLYSLEKAWSQFLVKRKNPWLCSNVFFEIQKSRIPIIFIHPEYIRKYA
jgi:hypothetical protein